MRTGAVVKDAGYYRGVAYAGRGRYEEANDALDGYLEAVGRAGEHYRQALVLDLEEMMAADDAALERAEAAGTASAFGGYLSTYPSGRHAEDARRLLDEAEARADDAAYRRAQAAGTSAAYGGYLKEYPNGRHMSDARRQHAQALAREDDAAYERAQASDTAVAYAEYLRKYPAERHAEEARRLREQKDLRLERVFRDCDGCPEMVVVPAGSYLMGSPSSEAARNDDQGPQRRVTIGEAFAVGVYEVRFASGTRAYETADAEGIGRKTGDRDEAIGR